MVRFVIEAVEVAEENKQKVHGDSRFKMVEWPVFPRVGEQVQIGEELKPVVQIYHWMEGKTPYLEATLEFSESEFAHLEKLNEVNMGKAKLQWHTTVESALSAW